MNFNIKVTENMDAKMTNLKVNVLTLLQNTFLASALVVASANFAFAQTGKLYLKGETKTNTTIDMVTGQYGNGTKTPSILFLPKQRTMLIKRPLKEPHIT